MDLVQVRGPHAVQAHDARRHADRRRIGGHLVQHHGPRGHAGVVAHPERPQDFGARPHQHVVAEGRVALAVVLARAAERHALVQGAVVADFGRFADDHAHAVVDEQPLPDFGARVDFDSRLMPRALGDIPRDELVPVRKEPVRPAVRPHGLEPGVQKVDLCPGTGRRVAVHNGIQFRFQSGKHQKTSAAPLASALPPAARGAPRGPKKPPSPKRDGGEILPRFHSVFLALRPITVPAGRGYWFPPACSRMHFAARSAESALSRFGAFSLPPACAVTSSVRRISKNQDHSSV